MWTCIFFDDGSEMACTLSTYIEKIFSFSISMYCVCVCVCMYGLLWVSILLGIVIFLYIEHKQRTTVRELRILHAVCGVESWLQYTYNMWMISRIYFKKLQGMFFFVVVASVVMCMFYFVGTSHIVMHFTSIDIIIDYRSVSIDWFALLTCGHTDTYQ